MGRGIPGPGAAEGRRRRAAGVSSAAFLALALVAAHSSAGAAEEGYISGLGSYPLRDTPQFSAEPASRLETGTKIAILEQQAGWIKVRSGNQTGWMPESVIGRQAPPSVQLGPLKSRVEQMESNLNTLVRENNMLKDENVALNEKVSSLRESLEKSRRSADRTRNLQRTWDIALGGGLVIFGWIAGYALAAASRRKGSTRKYVID